MSLSAFRFQFCYNNNDSAAAADACSYFDTLAVLSGFCAASVALEFTAYLAMQYRVSVAYIIISYYRLIYNNTIVLLFFCTLGSKDPKG